MEKDGDSEEDNYEEVVKQVVKRRFEGRGKKGRSDKDKRGEKQWGGGNKEEDNEDGGEKYTEKVIRKSYKEDGDGRKTEVMKWMIILQEREER